MHRHSSKWPNAKQCREIFSIGKPTHFVLLALGSFDVVHIFLIRWRWIVVWGSVWGISISSAMEPEFRSRIRVVWTCVADPFGKVFRLVTTRRFRVFWVRWCFGLLIFQIDVKIYGCLCFWSYTHAQFWKIKSPLRQEHGRHNVVRLAFVWCFDSVGWYLFDWTRCNRFGLESHRLDPTAQPGFQWQNQSCIRITYQKWFVILVMTGILVGGVDPRYRECFVPGSTMPETSCPHHFHVPIGIGLELPAPKESDE